MSKDIIDRIVSDLQAEQIISPDSYQVTDLLYTSHDGRLRTYGVENSSPYTSARRTEVKLTGGTVAVHRNTGRGEGVFATASHFSALDVIKGNENYHLDINLNPMDSSPYNRSYIFVDPNNGNPQEVGHGWGNIDVQVAGNLLDSISGLGNGSISKEVIDWIKSKFMK